MIPASADASNVFGVPLHRPATGVAFMRPDLLVHEDVSLWGRTTGLPRLYGVSLIVRISVRRIVLG